MTNDREYGSSARHSGSFRSSLHLSSWGDSALKNIQWPTKRSTRDSGISIASSFDMKRRSKGYFRDSGISMSGPSSSSASSSEQVTTEEHQYHHRAYRDSTLSISTPLDELDEDSSLSLTLTGGCMSPTSTMPLPSLTLDELHESEMDNNNNHNNGDDDDDYDDDDDAISTTSTLPPLMEDECISAALDELAEEATSSLITGEWSTVPAEEEIPMLDYLLLRGADINTKVHLPPLNQDISPLRIAMFNYTQARTRLLQGHLDIVIQKATLLHLIKCGADFWTKFTDGEDYNNAAIGSSVFDDLILFCAQHYVGGPSFSLLLVQAMIECDPPRLSRDDLTSAFEKLAAHGLSGRVDIPVGRYLLAQGITPEPYYLRQFRKLDDMYTCGMWRASCRSTPGRRFFETYDE